MSGFKLLLSVLLVFLSLTGSLKAQNIKFEHITDEDGLPQNVITSIYQDSYGFMWFGTQNGLARYDGYEFKIFQNKKGDSTSISNNLIEGIVQDASGTLWIGTLEGGVNSYDYISDSFKSYKQGDSGLTSNDILCLEVDEKGTLWLGTLKGGLCIYDHEKDSFKELRVHEEQDLNTVHSILFSGDTIYAGGEKSHLFKIDRVNLDVKKFIYGDLRKKASFKKLVKGRFPGILWIGTRGDGVVIFNEDTESFTGQLSNYDKERNNAQGLVGVRNTVKDIMVHDDGTLWICTAEGLSIFNPYRSTFRNIIESNDEMGLSVSNIKCVFKDKAGSIWIGTEGGGINVYHENNLKFQHFKKDQQQERSLKSNVVFSFLEDEDSLLWVGSYEGGITIYDRGQNKTAYFEDFGLELNHSSVLALNQDKRSYVWIGFYGGGIQVYDKKRRKFVEEFNAKDGKSISNNTIFDFEEVNEKEMWISSFKGIDVYNYKTKEFTRINESDGLSRNIVTDLKFDKDRNCVWVSTLKGGVNQVKIIDGKYEVIQFPKEDQENGISSNRVNCIFNHPNGDVWVGTSNGLNRLKKGSNTFDQYYKEDGLPDSYVYGIETDSEGRIWFSTNHGISSLTPSDSITPLSFKNYGIDDGLQANEFNQGAFYRSRKSGELLFGGVNGFNSFFPEEIHSNQNIPSVYLTSIKCFDKAIELDSNVIVKKSIVLDYEHNYLSFDFVGLDYFYPSKNRYSFKMEGVDKDWLPSSSRRYASYPNLSGGNYVFRVRASNSDGIWNEVGSEIYITIIPPFYETSWFYALMVLFIIFSVYMIYYIRTKQIKRENKRLEETVQSRTAELAEKNKDITSSIQYAQTLQEAILPSLDKLSKTFPDSFVLYKPKDIVSGDFYWFSEVEGVNIITAADCTGHGVPGAFMSMLGVNQFNSIVKQGGEWRPNIVLQQLHDKVVSVLNQNKDKDQVNDGMDLSLVAINEKEGKIYYAGANNPLLVLRKDSLELEVYKADKQPIGGATEGESRSFTMNEIDFISGDQIFLFSDGYPDQFGGPKNKKFMMKRFKKILVETNHLSKPEQMKYLDSTLKEWKGAEEQVDDILVIGITL
jgi:ligand-binding sensor domain-containing protein/serine phosphatase RsbU (regulator of sigma subunit)